MFKNSIIAIFILLALSLSGCASIREEQTAGDRSIQALEQAQDGGFVMAGYKSVTPHQSLGILLKTDAEGEEQWLRFFGEDLNEMRPYGLQGTRDGGFVITGTVKSKNHNDAFLLKTDSQGNKQWLKTFGQDKDDYAYSVAQTEDSGYILCGYTYSFSRSRFAAWLIRTDEEGNEIWSRTFGGLETYNQGYSVLQAKDGGFVMAGMEESKNHDSFMAWLIRTDEEGNEIWSRTFGEQKKRDYGYALRQTEDGGFIFIQGGHPLSYSGRSDLWLVKTDKHGEGLWSRSFFSDNGELKARSLQQTQDNGYVILATEEGGGLSYSTVLIKTSRTGQEQWSKAFGKEQKDLRAFSILETEDGHYMLAGTQKDREDGVGEAWLAKSDKSGKDLWSNTYGEAIAAGYSTNPLAITFFVLLFSLVMLNLVHSGIFFEDMKTRGERAAVWIARIMFLGPLGIIWYKACRKGIDSQAVSCSRPNILAKNFMLHWSIYIISYPILVLSTALFIIGPGYMFVGGLALLLEFRTVFLFFLIYIFIAWLIPVGVSGIISLATKPAGN